MILSLMCTILTASSSNNIYLNYKKNEILDIVPVADSEIVKYYNDNIGYYTSEKEMNVQEIVVSNDSLLTSS